MKRVIGLLGRYDAEVFVRFHLPQADGGYVGHGDGEDGAFQTDVCSPLLHICSHTIVLARG